jgi:hypothetical protein
VPCDHPLLPIACQHSVLGALSGYDLTIQEALVHASDIIPALLRHEVVEPIATNDVLPCASQDLTSPPVDEVHVSLSIDAHKHRPRQVEILPGSAPLLP